MKVWITNYALTEGILVVDGEIDETYPSMITYNRPGVSFSRICAHGEGKDWHRTWSSALQRAITVRAAKIKSHKKAIKRLEELRNFTVTDLSEDVKP